MREAFIKKFSEEVKSDGSIAYNQNILSSCFTYFFKQMLKSLAFETGIRCDGRHIKEFRPISIKTNVYHKLHGSALFQRGQSQVIFLAIFNQNFFNDF